ncbi:DUF6722 family protein [Bacteroides muris (ex Fokt et al. 2023)]|uniref:Uncharacterized protein n=1 Tax=Bacteroides muris (ex Fokt et al. 2023) TaxID=2937417 RepID=A0A9X2NW71_9BACE|nr:DUF6722 family protein [Bacteroides muris (ex Fokt et al. 2023)]MCR6506364.1 hypothetical protein [Bacteroides muris (ex Fokt et al. 2023)]
MGNWSEIQEAKKEVKEKDKVRRETLGKFFYDLAKLTFAAIVLGGLTPIYANMDNSINWGLIIAGTIFTIIFSLRACLNFIQHSFKSSL